MTFQQALEQVADDYRTKGYQVVVAPPPDERPPFARELDIDLLAYKPGEKKAIVEVKLTNLGFVGDENMVQLARLVDQQPEWRFDVVCLNSIRPEDEWDAHSRELDDAALRERIDAAGGLLHLRQVAAAMLLAWSACEAVLRRAAVPQDMDVENVSTLGLLALLAGEGIVSLAIHHHLVELYRVRNAVARGMQDDRLDEQAVRDVLRYADELMPLSSPGRLAS